uniref:C-type lectin domain-containing protein n=1 Tax=Plectus sambesii TaxID=2011161 RepID=A0A914UJX2_9BILA
MFMQLIIQLTACSLAMAITDLESQCNSIGGNLTHIYANGSCYVLHPQAVLYMFAKLSCNDILGYGGHLVHPKSSAEIDILLTMQQSGGVGYSWIGVEQPDWNSANNVGWYYTTPMDDNSPATYVKWKSGEPNGGWTANDENNVVLVLAVRSYEDWPLFAAHPYLCQYEESRKRPMTDLEQKCASVNSSFTHAFFNGNCYVFHPQTTPYYVAKLSCNDLAGYDGHLAFLKSVNDKNMAESLMRASIATGYRQAWVGVEQPDWNAANNVGWSYTTPTTESELATYLPWSSGEPGGGSYENIAALDATYTANYQDFPYTSTLSPLCRYEPSSRRNVTALETSCNQLATPNKYYYAGTCFFESASAATYSAKKTACPAMAPYYASLAILDTAEKRILARNIGKKSLSAASLDVKNLAYWTSLEQRPACPNNACNEEPGKSWYWIDSAGNTYSADLSNQGWASTYPSDSTNSKQLATLRYNGYTDVTDTTTALGLCQYSKYFTSNHNNVNNNINNNDYNKASLYYTINDDSRRDRCV